MDVTASRGNRGLQNRMGRRAIFPRLHGERAAWRRLKTFALFVAFLLAIQYPMALLHFPRPLDWIVLGLLVHCTAMLSDALCELFDPRRPRWANTPFAYLAPVEPRGFPQLVMLIGLLSITALALKVRGYAEAASMGSE